MLMKTDIVIVLAQRGWQAVSGVITIMMVAHFLTPELQGWYYSFLSIAALYTLFDLGLSLVVVQLAAHLFVDLSWGKLGRPEGAGAARFLQFTRQICQHYRLLACAFALLAIPGGYLFFSNQIPVHGVVIEWRFAWLALAIATSLAIFSLPALAIVEGSGNIKEVHQIRLIQGVLGSISCWLVLINGGGLWATAMPAFMSVCTVSFWIVTRRPQMIDRNTSVGKIHWKTEIWPLQWKIGLSWLSGYLLTAIYTPILFHYQGATVAGQMGLTLTIANMLGFLAQSWITRHVPVMAQLAAKREWLAMDALFKRDFILSTMALLLGAGGLCVLYLLLQYTPYQHRMLSFLPFAGLLGVALLNHLVAALAIQLRSYKQEPLVWVAVAASCITVPCAIWASKTYSADGVVATILCVQFCISLPISILIWRKSNKKWRAQFNAS